MRQGAEAILLSSLPDAATLQMAINAAEMGSLVLIEGYLYGLSKLVNGLADTVVDNQRSLLRKWLAISLKAVVTQKLIPTIDGDVEPVFDVLRITEEIRTAIREGDDLSIYDNGMDEQIYRLWRSGRISEDTALMNAADPVRMASMMK